MSLLDSFLRWSATTLEELKGDVHNIAYLVIMQCSAGKPHFPDPNLEASVAMCQSRSNPWSSCEGSDLTLTCWRRILGYDFDLLWHIFAAAWLNSDRESLELLVLFLGAAPQLFLQCGRAHCPAAVTTDLRECRCHVGVFTWSATIFGWLICVKWNLRKCWDALHLLILLMLWQLGVFLHDMVSYIFPDMLVISSVCPLP